MTPLQATAVGLALLCLAPAGGQYGYARTGGYGGVGGGYGGVVGGGYGGGAGGRGGGLKQFYFSWEDGPQQYTWEQADQRCRYLGMRLISLDNPEKDYYISSLIDKYEIEYIWTSGRREYGGFLWGHDRPVIGYTNWGLTGGEGRPQPDDREGHEECLAILNKFYPGDGITWHDVACHHKKHFVCEHY